MLSFILTTRVPGGRVVAGQRLDLHLVPAAGPVERALSQERVGKAQVPRHRPDVLCKNEQVNEVKVLKV